MKRSSQREGTVLPDAEPVKQKKSSGHLPPALPVPPAPALTFEDISRGEDAKLELQGVLELAAGYIQGLPHHSAELTLDEAAAAAFALRNIGERHASQTEELLAMALRATKFVPREQGAAAAPHPSSPRDFTPEESGQIREALNTAATLSRALSPADRKRFQHGLMILACDEGGNMEEAEGLVRAHREEFPVVPATQRPAADEATNKRTNLLLCLVGQWEAIVARRDWDEASSMMEDLQNMISHHPDLREYAVALKGIVDGYLTMTRLANRFNAP